jgi:hypothetical protein
MKLPYFKTHKKHCPLAHCCTGLTVSAVTQITLYCCDADHVLLWRRSRCTVVTQITYCDADHVVLLWRRSRCILVTQITFYRCDANHGVLLWRISRCIVTQITLYCDADHVVLWRRSRCTAVTQITLYYCDADHVVLLWRRLRCTFGAQITLYCNADHVALLWRKSRCIVTQITYFCDANHVVLLWRSRIFVKWPCPLSSWPTVGTEIKTVRCFAAMGYGEIQPFNAGIKSLRATLPDEKFYWGFYFLNRAFR